MEFVIDILHLIWPVPDLRLPNLLSSNLFRRCFVSIRSGRSRLQDILNYQDQFSKRLFLIGAGMVGLLVFFVLLSGLLSANLKMLIAPVLFFGSAGVVLWSR